MSLQAHIYSNIGGMAENQDCADYDIADNKGIFIIADGQGGPERGSLAAGSAVDSVMNAWEELKNRGGLDSTDMKAWLNLQLSRANDEIILLQKQLRCSMSCTIAVLVVFPDKLYYSTVGDCRLYMVSRGKILQLSQDHSSSYQNFLAGIISRHDINFDPDRHKLLRLMGDPVCCIPSTEAVNRPPEHGAFLLCSDGFWECLFEEEIMLDSLKSGSPQQWTEFMLLRIMSRRSQDSDNLSAVSIFAD